MNYPEHNLTGSDSGERPTPELTRAELELLRDEVRESMDRARADVELCEAQLLAATHRDAENVARNLTVHLRIWLLRRRPRGPTERRLEN
jgi:hypothetical protein